MARVLEIIITCQLLRDVTVGADPGPSLPSRRWGVRRVGRAVPGSPPTAGRRGTSPAAASGPAKAKTAATTSGRAGTCQRKSTPLCAAKAAVAANAAADE